MKKIVCVVACLLVLMLMMMGCGNTEQIDAMETRIVALEESVSALQEENETLMSWYKEVKESEEAKAASRPDFEAIYQTAPDDGTVSLASDGLSLSVDTNPYNIEDFISSEALLYIEEVNAALNLPESLYDKMLETRALDGRQSSDYDNVSVSWSYHPDNGLNIIYEAK